MYIISKQHFQNPLPIGASTDCSHSLLRILRSSKSKWVSTVPGARAALAISHLQPCYLYLSILFACLFVCLAYTFPTYSTSCAGRNASDLFLSEICANGASTYEVHFAPILTFCDFYKNPFFIYKWGNRVWISLHN